MDGTKDDLFQADSDSDTDPFEGFDDAEIAMEEEVVDNLRTSATISDESEAESVDENSDYDMDYDSPGH